MPERVVTITLLVAKSTEHHELKYDSGYSEAHERAQNSYEGYPWEKKF